MKKIFGGVFSVSVFLMVFLVSQLFCPFLAYADGMILEKTPYSDNWDYSEETNQQAFISYEDGIEKMIISVGTSGEESNNNLVWIFPVPSSPEEIDLDILEEMPNPRGENVPGKIQSVLYGLREKVRCTQIYTFNSCLPTGRVEILNLDGLWGWEMNNTADSYVHIEKNGIISEVITAQTGSGIYEYLGSKGFKIGENSIPVLDNYIGKDFSFVVSWIDMSSNSYSSRTIQRGVSINFPSEKIYFPLMPTSIYEGQTIPISIKVLGYVSPEIYKDIKDYTEVNYYFNARDFSGRVRSSSETRPKYTKILINAPSNFFTEDLWMENKTPSVISLFSFLIDNSKYIYFFMVLLISFIAGSLAGALVFKEFRNPKGMLFFGFLGLFNIFTILGVWFVTRLAKTKKDNNEVLPVLEKLKQSGCAKRMRFGAFLYYISLPFVIVALFLSQMIVPSLISKHDNEVIYAFLLMCLVFFVFIISLLLCRATDKEKPLLDILKKNGYSTKVLQPYDSRKTYFLVLFSISFLIICPIVFEIVEKLVGYLY